MRPVRRWRGWETPTHVFSEAQVKEEREPASIWKGSPAKTGDEEQIQMAGVCLFIAIPRLRLTTRPQDFSFLPPLPPQRGGTEDEEMGVMFHLVPV